MIPDPSPDGAKKLGLTDEMIKTDVEVRLAGVQVVSNEEAAKLVKDAAVLHVSATVTEGARAECILVQLDQNVQLRRNGAFAYNVPTWSTGTVAANLNAQDIRDEIKNEVDTFLNAFLSVNPKK